MRARLPIALAALGSFAIALVAVVGAARADFPVTIENCGRTITFAKPPARAVSHDMNISEIMFALGLQDRMVGVTGITGWYKMTPEFRRALGSLPELAAKEPTLENLLAANPDFFFAGWYYGMHPGGPVTPDSLAAFGIPVYVLTESCAHIRADSRTDSRSAPRAADIEVLYRDIHNIGRIFGRSTRADALIGDYRRRVDAVRQRLAGAAPVRVFLFDNGEDKPFTAGKYGMPTAIIAAAAGRNVLDDVAASWGHVGWESVIARDPEFVVLTATGDDSWRDRWRFLKTHPALASIRAMREDRFLALEYTELTPGPGNIAAIEKLARALHPERFR
ncbi:MAG: ABC transporter substrate-binding protein [Rhodospirillales bacterium]|nr:ABC transporter substrate-binding protein [Rhodospirillales bacterium]